MKFVHIADMHFDTPFHMLSDRANLGEVRRLDQRVTRLENGLIMPLSSDNLGNDSYGNNGMYMI